MLPFSIVLLLIIVIYFIYKKSVLKKTAEIVSIKESPNKNVNLFSTIDKTKIAKPIIETDGHYYIVKEIITSVDCTTTIIEKEYEFNKGDMYNNKIEARLFYDNKMQEIVVLKSATDKKINLELYLIRHSNLVLEKKYLLIDANGREDVENKKLESFLLSSMGANKNANTVSNAESICSKNSFLDGDYKD